MQGFIILHREKGMELLINDPKAFLLFSLIAFRARRTALKYSTIPLKPNQALLGDHEIIKFSRGEYRRVLKKLKEYGLIEFETTKKGTIATITSIDIYDINAEQPSISPMEIGKKQPSNSQQNTNKEPFDNQETTNKDPPEHQLRSMQEPLTNNEPEQEWEENKKTTIATTQQKVDVSLYPCLQKFEGIKSFQLTDTDKKTLMKYSIDRVTQAIAYASHPLVQIKKDLISMLHWHCKHPTPCAPPDESTNSSSVIPQHALAYEYTKTLKERGYFEYAEKNRQSIPEGKAWILEKFGWTTVALNSNSLETLRQDFANSTTLIQNNHLHNTKI